MASVTADKVIVELEARLDEYVSKVNSARANFRSAMWTTEGAATGAETVVKRASSGMGAAVTGAAMAAESAAATIATTSRAAAETYTVSASTIARASELNQRNILATAAAAEKAQVSIMASGPRYPRASCRSPRRWLRCSRSSTSLS